MSEKKTYVIGLTGQSGAGKTTVCGILRDIGFAVINADELSRQVTVSGGECLRELAEVFGDGIITENGELDRRKLASLTFGDKKELKKLGVIIYPFINEALIEEINKHKKAGERYILYDAPTLFESRADGLCDFIISVTASEAKRAERIKKRDGVSDDEIKKRFESQHSEQYFIKKSDLYIKNNKTEEDLADKAREVADKIQKCFAD
ncbi:MAG: dephospho-CoA kinase [Ruminococcus sp.]|jgi:dephospho-CoA kinase|nr:dephospho-CoA kinase [Ruminococcus sp.]